MFRKLNEFFADLEERWSDWWAGRITTVEEAKANPERFVRQLIAYAKNGYPWFQDPKDRFAYASYYDKHIICRIFVMSKTFGFEISHTFYGLQLRDLMEKDAVFSHTAWKCSVRQDHRGEHPQGNMKMRELFNLVANRPK